MVGRRRTLWPAGGGRGGDGARAAVVDHGRDSGEQLVEGHLADREHVAVVVAGVGGEAAPRGADDGADTSFPGGGEHGSGGGGGVGAGHAAEPDEHRRRTRIEKLGQCARKR
jgi:hypothetical protein